MTMVRLAPESTTVTISNSTLNVSGTFVISTVSGTAFSRNAGIRFTNINSTVAGAFGIASAGTTVAGDLTKIRVLGMALIAGSSGNVYFGSDTAVSTIGGVFGNSTAFIALAANGGLVLPTDPWGVGYFQTSACSTAGAIHLNFIATTTGPWAGTVVWTTTS